VTRAGLRRVAGVIASSLGSLALVVAPASAAESPPASVCSRFGVAQDQGATLDDPVLDEVSGVAASRTQPPLLWVHDDSGGAPAVYAIRPDGTLVATYTIDGATNTDWEDLAVGRGPKHGVSYLYVGDIGQNNARRDHVTVYRVAEPEAPLSPTGTLTGAAVISLRYPDHPVDAESMFVDPRAGDLYVIDKELLTREGRVFRAPARRLVDGADVTMREVASFTLEPDDPVVPSRVARFPGTWITGADISPDGSTILVRTYRRVLAFSRGPHGSVAGAFGRPPCAAPQIDEPQGEAVGFAANGASYFTISEGVGAAVHRFTVRPPLRG
jgi:hypothetical protein